jgi:hypothetical protein
VLVAEAIRQLEQVREQLGGDAELVTADGQPVRGFAAVAPLRGPGGQPLYAWDEGGRWSIDDPSERL